MNVLYAKTQALLISLKLLFQWMMQQPYVSAQEAMCRNLVY